MKNLIIKIDYELLFDRSESMIYDKNDKFWELLKKLAKDNPDAVIYVTGYLQKEHATPLFEYMKLECCQSHIQKILDNAYRQFYYPVPMTFHKDVEVTDELLKTLLEVDR